MVNILVLCTGNSCRSIIGEAMLNHFGRGRIQAWSAGSHPLGRLNADAVALLQRYGISTGDLFSKSWDTLENQQIDIAVTVCDNAAGEVCPIYMNPIPKAHWGTVDPGHVKGTEEEVIAAFEDTYRRFERRIKQLLALPIETLSAQELAKKLNEIG